MSSACSTDLAPTVTCQVLAAFGSLSSPGWPAAVSLRASSTGRHVIARAAVPGAEPRIEPLQPMWHLPASLCKLLYFTSTPWHYTYAINAAQCVQAGWHMASYHAGSDSFDAYDELVRTTVSTLQLSWESPYSFVNHPKTSGQTSPSLTSVAVEHW